MLDGDKDGDISLHAICIDILDEEIAKLILPLIEELKNDTH